MDRAKKVLCYLKDCTVCCDLQTATNAEEARNARSQENVCVCVCVLVVERHRMSTEKWAFEARSKQPEEHTQAPRQERVSAVTTLETSRAVGNRGISWGWASVQVFLT